MRANHTIPIGASRCGQFHPGLARAAKRGELTPARDNAVGASLLDENPTTPEVPIEIGNDHGFTPR